jgi:hypothetical protein
MACCAICLCPLSTGCLALHCGHVLHCSCLLTAFEGLVNDIMLLSEPSLHPLTVGLAWRRALTHTSQLALPLPHVLQVRRCPSGAAPAAALWSSLRAWSPRQG